MRNITSIRAVGAIVFAAVMMLPGIALATKEVSIGGTVSRGQLKNDCAAVGGSYTSTGGHYSCYNSKNDNLVYCTSNGKCTGWVTRQAPSHTVSGILHSPSGVKTTGRATSPKHGVRRVKFGGVKARHLGHGRVVKIGGLKTKPIYRSHPTDSGGKGLTSYHSTGPTFPMAEHHGGRHH